MGKETHGREVCVVILERHLLLEVGDGLTERGVREDELAFHGRRWCRGERWSRFWGADGLH